MKDYVTDSHVVISRPPTQQEMWSREDAAKESMGRQYVEMPLPTHPDDPYGIPQHAPGSKLDNGKVMADLLQDFNKALIAVAEIATFGANKYSRGGWKEVPDGYNRYSAAMLRHWLSEPEEDLDQDSGLLHAAHLAWNALARLQFLLKERV